MKLELKACFAGCICESLNASMILVPAAIEHNGGNIGIFGFLRNERTELRGAILGDRCLRLGSGCRCQCAAAIVID